VVTDELGLTASAQRELPVEMHPATLRVPQDFFTVEEALRAAQAGVLAGRPAVLLQGNTITDHPLWGILLPQCRMFPTRELRTLTEHANPVTRVIYNLHPIVRSPKTDKCDPHEANGRKSFQPTRIPKP